MGDLEDENEDEMIEAADPGTPAAWDQICALLQESEELCEQRVAVDNQIRDYIAQAKLSIIPFNTRLDAAEARERENQGQSPRAMDWRLAGQVSLHSKKMFSDSKSK